jgi:flagellar biosynthesis protein FlhF
MQVKRFRESTVRGALAAVKRDLGPDALVLSTMLVPMRGWRRLTGRREVEVTAGLAVDVSESRPLAPAVTPVPDIAPGDEDVVARLAAAGLDRALAAEVAASIPHRVRRTASPDVIRQAVAGRIALLASGGDAPAPIEVFVGPPGAGKTTTIAKIAAQDRARRTARWTLVAADGYRVGAVEQLRLYADILSVTFAVARTPQDLDRVLAASRPPMLVDTAGRSPDDRGIPDVYGVLAGRSGVRTHLVLPAATSPRDAARICDRYEPARPERVVLTRVDEADSVAPLVRVLRERHLGVSFLGNGQRVPEDLHPATPAMLAAAILGDRLASEEGRA